MHSMTSLGSMLAATGMRQVAARPRMESRPERGNGRIRPIARRVNSEKEKVRQILAFSMAIEMPTVDQLSVKQ